MKLFDVLVESTTDEGEDPFERGSTPSTDKEKLKQLKHKAAVAARARLTIYQTIERLEKKYGLYHVPDSIALKGNTRQYQFYNTKYYDRAGDHIFKRLDKMTNERDKWAALIGNMNVELKKLTKKVRDQNIAQHALIRSAGGVKSIPASEVPDQLPSMLGKKPTFDNPYFKATDGRYAGDPMYYEWTPTYLTHYTHLEEAFERNGIPGFTIVYAGTYFRAGRYGASSTNCLNFMAYAVDGKFMWKRYDVGGGSATTTNFVNGKKESTPLWMASDDDIDSHLRTWFPEYFK